MFRARLGSDKGRLILCFYVGIVYFYGYTNPVELFQLRYFESVVRHGSLTAAAVDCHVSQPSLSTQIRNLEKELGARLLERRPRGVTPTRAGERLLFTTRRLLAEAESCTRAIRRRDFAGLPELRIGIQPFLAALLLPRALSDLLRDPAARRIVVHELPHHQLPAALAGLSIDLALTTLAGPPAALESRPLGTLRYGLYCPAGHALARARRPRLRDLLPHRLALYQDPAELTDRVSRLATENGVTARIIFNSDQALTVFEMAAAGLGVAVLPTLFRNLARQRGLVMRPLAEPDLNYPVAAVWSRSTPKPPGIEPFLSACRAATTRGGIMTHLGN